MGPVTRRVRVAPSVAHDRLFPGDAVRCAACDGTGRVPAGQHTVTCGRCFGAGWHHEKGGTPASSLDRYHDDRAPAEVLDLRAARAHRIEGDVPAQTAAAVTRVEQLDGPPRHARRAAGPNPLGIALVAAVAFGLITAGLVLAATARNLSAGHFTAVGLATAGLALLIRLHVVNTRRPR